MGDDEASTSASPQPHKPAPPPGAAGSVKQHISSLVASSLRATAPQVDDVQPMVEVCAQNFGDYQCNNAMGLWPRVQGSPGTSFRNPNAIGQAIAENLPACDAIESTSVAGPGFVNIVLSNTWIAKRIQDMLVNGIKTWAPIVPVKRVVLDFSSPNIAKEMHVGHLRSTIIGETLARILQFLNVYVLRRNHVGDWGTQFGMLIEFLFEKFPNWEELGSQAIGDLQLFYKASKERFDNDEEFKVRAQQAVVRLQGGGEKYRTAWKRICQISRNEFDEVYKLLDVQLEEKGESFYNPYIPQVLEELSNQGLIEESKGARVIFIEGHKSPLIVVKTDGGYNYASTDLAALWYRLNVEKAEWIIYVTDVGQQQHFDMIFKAAKMAGWLPDPNEKKFPKTSHVGFGLVLGADGKRFRTRSTEVVRLRDLLDEAKSRSKSVLVELLDKKGKQYNCGFLFAFLITFQVKYEVRFCSGKLVDWTDEELDKTSKELGYGAVKYADLKNNRLTNYTFSFDQMLSVKGNTAVYLQYAHARICSIIGKSNMDVEDLKMNASISLGHPDERALGLHLIRFSEAVEEACNELLPSVLCDYLYNLSEMFTRFYTSCQVVGSEEEPSRVLLCEATGIVMRQIFQFLGITPVYKL
ncbi:hypothetical protein QYE76_038364 [Lolium multiflorum]|uniref:arginine--tRNA ligase n=1 Tax=Lolium multiflorum TaxID=4521 RepID=A0AAD8T9G7_LOLMU|nr:hypothetical protein QYE76_038364 [Lolium multiflorum]